MVGPIIDAIEFNEEDLECYNDNPVEYYRRNAPEVIKFDLKRQCLSFISDSLSRVDKSQKFGLLDFMLKYVKGILEDSSATIVRKEAVMMVAERMDKIIFMTYKEAGYDYFIAKADEFLTNEHGFVRMRACKLISIMMYPEYSNEQVLKNLSEKVTALLKDEALPVRCAAA